MGRDNHNAGMHFVYYTSKVSEADAIAYIERKETEIRQNDIRKKYEDLMQYDKSCRVDIRNIEDKVLVNYYDEYNSSNYSMYFYPISHIKDKKKNRLTLWVGYDIGGKNNITGEMEPRGYYFYFTNFFARKITGRKLLLFEVDRKSRKDFERAIEISARIGKTVVANYYDRLEIRWDKPIREKVGLIKVCWMNTEEIRCFRTIKNCDLVLY